MLSRIVVNDFSHIGAFLGTLFETAEDAIFVMDGPRFIDCNPATLEMYGCRRKEDIVGHTPIDFSPPLQPDGAPSAEKATRFVAEALAGRPQQFEWRHCQLDRTEFDVEVKLNRFSVAGAPFLAAVVRDITSRRRAESARRYAEQALRRTEEQLRQAQKMEAIGRLAGGIAHDFNNMLTVVLMFSSLLLQGLRDGDPTREGLEEIKRAADRSAALTRRLLAFSRQQVLEPRVVDLNEVVRGMEDMIRRLVGENIEVVTAFEPALGKVKVDANQIEQVVMNLVVNARDAMSGGGTLTLRTANVELDAQYAGEHLGTGGGSYAMLSVSDTGVGMDPATQARVFEPFFTTKEEGKGTGLGLATAFGIVKQSEGDISVHSQPGKGTTFRICLPRSVDSKLGAAAPPPVVTTLRGSETILLVEDDDAIRRVARAILVRNGYRVLEASHPGEALLLFERHEPTVALLLTDVVLPRMSGRQLAGRLIGLQPALPVLYMSGYAEDALSHDGALDPSASFLQKPITPDALLRKVRAVLATAGARVTHRDRP